MALLKKLKSATLIEALVATIIIIIIFMISSLILNNLLATSFSKNTHGVENRIHEIIYSFDNNKFKLPYNEEYEQWDIEVFSEGNENIPLLFCRAVHKDSKREVIKISYYERR